MSMSPRGSQTPSASDPILTFRHGTQETLEAMLAEAMNTPLVFGPSTAKSPNWADVVDEARNILLDFDNCWPNTTATMPVVEEPSTVEDLVDYVDLLAAHQDDNIKTNLQVMNAELRRDMVEVVKMIAKVQQHKEAEMLERLLVLEAENERRRRPFTTPMSTPESTPAPQSPAKSTDYELWTPQVVNPATSEDPMLERARHRARVHGSRVTTEHQHFGLPRERR